MLTTTQVNEIVVQETLGLEHGEDTPEEAEFREKVKPQIAKIKAEGKQVQVPNE